MSEKLKFSFLDWAAVQGFYYFTAQENHKPAGQSNEGAVVGEGAEKLI